MAAPTPAGYLPRAPSGMVNLLVISATPEACCKRCAKKYWQDPEQKCIFTGTHRRCNFCQGAVQGQGGEACNQVDQVNFPRLHQVQSLAKAFLLWQDANPGRFDVLQDVRLSGTNRRILDRDRQTGQFLFPPHTPDCYVDLYYSQYKLSREMRGSSRS